MTWYPMIYLLGKVHKCFHSRLFVNNSNALLFYPMEHTMQKTGKPKTSERISWWWAHCVFSHISKCLFNVSAQWTHAIIYPLSSEALLRFARKIKQNYVMREYDGANRTEQIFWLTVSFVLVFSICAIESIQQFKDSSTILRMHVKQSMGIVQILMIIAFQCFTSFCATGYMKSSQL